MPLKKCIEVTANLDDADVTSVLDSFDSYQGSMEQDVAAKLAIDDVIASLGQERKDYLQLFNDTYPDALKEAGQKADLTPLPKPKPVEAAPKPVKKTPPLKMRKPEPLPPIKIEPEIVIRDGKQIEVTQKQAGDFIQRDTSKKSKPKKSISVDNLTKLVNNLQRNYPGLRLLDFEIRVTQAEAFGSNSVAENGIIKGGFYSGTNTIVLIAENIKDINDAMSVIRHEAVGHYGLRVLLGEEAYDKLLARVYEARFGELKAQYDWVAKAYPELVAQNDVRKIADEMLAHAAETKTESSLLTKIYDAIIKLLNKLGLVLDTVSHKEVNALIRLSEANLRKDIRPTVSTMQHPLYMAEPAPQTDSKEFKKWFGNSKVADKKGEPLVVYHGTDAEIEIFDRELAGSGPSKFGFWMTGQEGFAELFGGKQMPLYIKMENPKIITTERWNDIRDAHAKDGSWFESWRETLKKQNYDGLKIKGGKVLLGKFEVEDPDIYAVFEPTQIKSATGNIGAFDPNDPNVMFSRAADNMGNVSVGQSLGMPEEGKKDLFVRLAQDSFNRIKTMQETILKKGGTIRTESDVYLAEERSSSKIAYELKAFESKYQKPLIDLMGDKNLEPEEVDLYVIAKHAQERNEYIASINDDMQDGGSGMTTQQAKDILAEFENKREDLEAAAQIIYDVNNQTLDTLVKEGHMKEEAANELRERWDYYVPLKGKDGEDYRLGTGVGYNIAGSQFKHAMGRGEGNLPESPTAHSFAQAETAIVRTEKSRIGKALVELVRANPDPEFWSIGQRTYKQFEDLYGTPFEGYEDQPPPPMVNNIDYKQVMAITPEERALAKAEGRKPKPKVVYKLDRNYKHRPDVFSVMAEGEELLIKIEDRVVMEQLTKANATQLNAIVRGFGRVNRYLAMVNTGLNLEFVLGNFERDIQTALIHLSGEQSAKLALKVTKGVPSAMRGIWQGVFDTKGKSKYRQLWDEMQKEGGAIGFFGLEDIETKVKHLQNKLKRKHGVLGTTKRGVLLGRDLILDANLAVENGVRLSAYKEVRDELIANGMSASDAKAKAATVSKNLTVNFNRKGEWAPVFNSLWLFSSVSIQGSARIIYSLAKHKRTRQIVAGIATAAFFNALYNSGAGDDDDGIPYWDKISEYEKQTNMIFMHPDGDNEVGTGGGGRYFKFRMPYGYNVFWYTGLATYNAAFNPRATLPKTAMNMLDAVLNAYNPIQGADLLDTITPTIAKPFEQDKRNINFMGGNIRPDYIFDQYDRPSSQKFFGSTNKYLVDAFVDLNELTGGDETHPGWWDWSPQTVKHYTGWVTGGAGMFAERMISGGVNLATGEEIDTRNIPFIRSMTGTPSARFDSERYYEALKQVAAVEAQLKLYKGTDRWSEYKQDNIEVHKLALHVRRYKNKIKKLREQRDKAYIDDDRDLAREKTEEIRQNMMTFSMLYDDAIEVQEY